MDTEHNPSLGTDVDPKIEYAFRALAHFDGLSEYIQDSVKLLATPISTANFLIRLSSSTPRSDELIDPLLKKVDTEFLSFLEKFRSDSLTYLGWLIETIKQRQCMCPVCTESRAKQVDSLVEESDGS